MSKILEVNIQEKILGPVLRTLETYKAEDIVTFDLRERSSLMDYLVIANGQNSRHLSALADHVLRDMKNVGISAMATEGLDDDRWVLIDFGDLVLHLFRPDVRTMYNLEALWQNYTRPSS